MITMRLLILLLVTHVSSEQNNFLADKFPVPVFRGINTEVQMKIIEQVNGCMIREYGHHSIICLGNKCTDYPSQVYINTTKFKIQTTGISVIKKDDFLNIENLSEMVIDSNLNLRKLEPGCFRNMYALTNLSITSSLKLHFLVENVFEGLVNLRDLNLLKNGFLRVIFATQALSVKYVPNLNRLVLNENNFVNIYKNDFKAMLGSLLKHLEMFTCQIENIHPESLNPLVNLEKLRLGQNQFNETTVTNLIKEIVAQKIPLQILSLYNAGFRTRPPMHLLNVVGESNISYLNIGKNTFDNLNENSFPALPNLRLLDLSSCLLLHIADDTFKKMPKLESLFLAYNRLPFIPKGVLLPQIKDLDLSGNTGNPISKSYLTVDDNVFENMSQMRSLKLSNNLISTVTNLTFFGLTNLLYLSLKNASIFEVRPGAFLTLRKLKYLNFENNHLIYVLTDKVLEGLDALETFLLGGCSIDNLFTISSPFEHLKNVTYLGLDRNQLYSVAPTTFPPLSSLVTLDLSQNILTQWNTRLFENMSLQELDMSQNKIKFWTVAMLEDIQHLRRLNLEGNPFTCDCSLFGIAKWLRTHKMTAKYIEHDEYNPKCVNTETKEPMLIIHFLDYIRDHYVCDDPPINKAVLLSVFAVLVACSLIASILGYVYRTHVRHWILLLRLTFRRYFKFKKTEQTARNEYKYDAFVSYSNEDQDFVINLVTMLENYEPFLKLCVYERDFQIGMGISESVLKSVAASRKTLLIISDAFVRSQWCRWEAKLAEHHHLFFNDSDLRGPCGTLLMILLNSVSEINFTPTLKYLLKTRIYLEWSTEPQKQRIFWEKLRKKLSSPTERAYESHITLQET